MSAFTISIQHSTRSSGQLDVIKADIKSKKANHKISANHVSDKELIFRIYREFLKLKNKKEPTQCNSGQNS